MTPGPVTIYFASKLHHADKLLKFGREGFHFISRWMETGNLAINATKPAAHWQEENFHDITAADYVLVYAEPGETLKTALIEVGFAMAHGKPIIVIGDHDSYRPWRGNSKRVQFCATIGEALDMLARVHARKGAEPLKC